MPPVRVQRAGPERIDALQPLWEALHAHHAAGGVRPVRDPADSWRRRRAEYEAWLAGPDTALLLALQDDEPVGYLMLRVGAGPATWAVGDRVAEIETLSVLPDARRAGVGRALIEAARAAAAELGAEALSVSLAHENETARSFYEREGFEPFYLSMLLHAYN